MKDTNVDTIQVTVQAVLCWSEYYNGKWQPTKTSDVNQPTKLSRFDPAGPNAFDRRRLGLSVTEGAGLLRVTLYTDWASTYFVLYNTHSLPVPKESHNTADDSFQLQELFRAIGVADGVFSMTYGSRYSRDQMKRPILKMKRGLPASAGVSACLGVRNAAAKANVTAARYCIHYAALAS